MIFDANNEQPATESTSQRAADIGERTALQAAFTDPRSQQLIRQAHQEWLAALDAIRDPIFIHDKDFRVTRANRAYAGLAGLTVKEVVGKPYYEMFPRMDGPLPACKALTHHGGVTEEEVQLADGRVFLSRATSVLDPDGVHRYSLHIMYDITQRKQDEQALLKLNRTLKALSAGNHELIHATDEIELLRAMCRVIVDKGGYPMAWVGYPQQDAAQSIKPMAQTGHDDGYLQNARISWADTERGRGPAGRAVRSGEIQVAQNIQDDPDLTPWRTEAARRGYASLIALPLLDQGRVLGVLAIYADEAEAFDESEIALLHEMSGDLAFGIATLRLRQEQQRSAEQLRKGLEDTVQSIATMVEMRDPYTAGHQHRVADLAAAIAAEMGLTADRVHGIHLAGTIHDLGKIQVPAEILSKPRRLSEIEYSLVKEHPQSGYDILKNIDFPWPIAQMVLQHHERLDGSGYPQGLKGDAILLEASILAVADTVDAMSSHRPYRPGLGMDAALDEIGKGRGVLYHAEVVDACVRLFRDKGFEFK